jgi:hypothetical protein
LTAVYLKQSDLSDDREDLDQNKRLLWNMVILLGFDDLLGVQRLIRFSGR